MVLLRMMAVCLTLLTSAVVSAQVVECIDADGKKTYAQTCPNGATRQREVEALAPTKTGTPNAATQKKMQDDEKAFEKRRDARLKAQAEAEEKDKKAKKDSQTCIAARNRLDLLNTGRQYKQVDPNTGEHVPMEEEPRQAEIDRLNAQIADACR